MSFSLEPGEPVGRGLVRVMDAQVERLRALGEEANQDVDAYVHAARVRCKRLRAVLRLCRPLLGKEFFQRHDHWWRDAARGLSRLRDLAAREETIEALSAESAPAGGSGALESAKLRFASERLDTGDLDEGRAIARFARALQNAPRVTRKDLKGVEPHDLVRAMGRTYRNARRAMQAAYATGEVERFHDWRKASKHLGLQLKLVRKVCPSQLSRARPAAQLGEVLGRLQDVCVVLDGLVAPATLAQMRSQERLRGALATEQRRLMQAARSPGEELFALSRKAFEQELLKDIRSN